MKEQKASENMYALAQRLFPVCRSITGHGVRTTLNILQEHIPLTTHEIPSGTRAFDWIVPPEWNIDDAYVMDTKGKKVIDFKKNNLHVVGYSLPIDTTMTLAELEHHLHSIPEQPTAIPYKTSYYNADWGFCLSHRDRRKLKKGTYRVVIKSTLAKGSLTYGEYIIPGKTKKEVLLSTYVCHPSLANNELSGPIVTTFLAKWIASQPRRYTYRVVFVPETIGAIVYLSKHLKAMQRHTIAGYVLTCVGDDRAYSFLPSRKGDTLADRVALHVLRKKHPSFKCYSYVDRGSDERQYCAPGVDLPVASMMRSKYGTYPEYHTSLDNLDVISPQGLHGALELYKDCIELLEHNDTYSSTCAGEPQLSRHGLFHTMSGSSSWVKNRLVYLGWQFLGYADGKSDLITIADTLNIPASELYSVIETLQAAHLIKKTVSRRS